MLNANSIPGEHLFSQGLQSERRRERERERSESLYFPGAKDGENINHTTRTYGLLSKGRRKAHKYTSQGHH